MAADRPRGGVSRRSFLGLAAAASVGLASADLRGDGVVRSASPSGGPNQGVREITLLLAGDVMTGRGIDQVLPHSVDPTLHEPWVTSATTYVEIAEEASGSIPSRVDLDYVWGDALEVLAARRPDARIVNLETAITAGGTPWPGKGIHYRMHPGNAPLLTAAGIDCCTLANNHVLDWGRGGLADTVATLAGVGVAHPGAGADLGAAMAPAALALPSGGRVLVFSLGHTSSGIPPGWAAGEARSGVWLEELDDGGADRLAAAVAAVKRPGDVVVASVHWGGNWGHHVPQEQRLFARRIIEDAGVDVVHGHSSHHPKAIEVHRRRPILYGCGDLVNDYEGISGHEEFRTELRPLYFLRLDAADGHLVNLEIVPMEMRRFRLQRVSEDAARWLAGALDRVCRQRGARVELGGDGALELRWQAEEGPR